MQIVTIFILFLSILNSTPLTDQAYKEYKRKNYTKAFELYKKDGSPKAIYNMAVFYEKGLGVAKNPQKSKNLYKRYLNLLKNDISSGSICSDKRLKYVKKTMRKLHKNRELQKLISSCKKRYPKAPKECQAKRRVLKKRYYKEAEGYDCVLFKKFPKIMKRHFKDKERFKKYQANYNSQAMDRVSEQAKIYVKPVLKFYKQRELKCAKRAKSFGDLKRCNYSYILDMGQMIFRDYAPMLGDSYMFASKKEKQKIDKKDKSIMSPKQKQNAILEIKKDIKYQRYFID